MKLIVLLLILNVTNIMWGDAPRIVFPKENGVILSGTLFIFIEPTPAEIESQYNVNYEIYDRKTGKTMTNGIIYPDKHYNLSIDVSQWQSSDYFMKVIFSNKKNIKISKSSWQNFFINNNKK